jgi:hypothetical protein
MGILGSTWRILPGRGKHDKLFFVNEIIQIVV